MLIAPPPGPPSPVALVPIGQVGETAALKLAEDLRGQGFTIDLGYSGNLARRLRRANRINAFAAILLGDDELARGAATLRNLNNGTQSETPLGELPARLRVLADEQILF
jgi:histidyl-tRNA synthetase